MLRLRSLALLAAVVLAVAGEAPQPPGTAPAATETAMLKHALVPARRPGPPDLHIVVLHGLGDSLDGWRPVAEALALDEAAWVFVQAPLPYHDGWSWFRIPGLTGPDDGPADMAADLAASRQRLDALLAHLQTQGIAPERTVLMGFSQGCCMVLDQALRGPRRFAGVIGISGFVGDAGAYPAAFGPAARQQRFLVTHGLWDDLLPAAQTEVQIRALRAAGLDLDWRTYGKGHSLDPAREMPELAAWLRQRAVAAGSK